MTVFAVGDVVRLNSGGPLMTISAASKDGNGGDCQAIWFRNDEKAFASFPARCLTLVSRDGS